MMKRVCKKSVSIIFLAAMLTSVVAFYACAKDQKKPQHGPPPEAIEACKDKEVGFVTEFKGRKGESLEAVCMEKKGQIVAVPVNAPPQK